MIFRAKVLYPDEVGSARSDVYVSLTRNIRKANPSVAVGASVGAGVVVVAVVAAVVVAVVVFTVVVAVVVFTIEDVVLEASVGEVVVVVLSGGTIFSIKLIQHYFLSNTYVTWLENDNMLN